MAITYTNIKSIAQTPYKLITSSYTGSLGDFSLTVSGLDPFSEYLWGYSFDVQSGSGRSGMSWNGNASQDNMVYGPGYGTYKKFQGSAIHRTSSSSSVVIRGVEYTGSLNIRGALRLFFIRMS